MAPNCSPYTDLRPKGRGTKASGGVRHGDSYRGIITDIYVFIYIYINPCPRIISTASGHGDEAAGFSGRTGLRSKGAGEKLR